MIRDPRIRAREIGDVETLHLEERKRREWVWENALRRHNFVGFVGELVKEVVKGKQAGGEKEYEEWVEGAKKKTLERLEKGKAGAEDE